MSPDLRSIATYLVARLIPAAVTTGLTLLCIQWMSAADYAAYSATMLSVAMAAGFAGAISGQPMLRYGRELSPQALRLGLGRVPLMASVFALPVLVAYLVAVLGVSASLFAAMVMVPLLAWMDTRRGLFVAHGAARSVLMLDVTRSAVAVIGVLLLFAAWAPSTFAAVLAQGVAVVVPLLAVRPYATHLAVTGTRTLDRAYLGFGLGIAGWMAVVLGLAMGERAILVSLVGLEGTGHYAAQADLVNAVFAAVGGALGSAMMPAYLSQTHQRDPVLWRRLQRLWQTGMLAVALVCLGAGLLLVAVPLGRLSDAVHSDPLTGVLLVAAAAAWTAGGFVQKPLELNGQTRRIFLGALVALGFFAVTAPLLASVGGMHGVALAKLMAGLGFIAVMLWWSRKAVP